MKMRSLLNLCNFGHLGLTILRTSAISASTCRVRNLATHTGSRTSVKAYDPGEKLPLPGEKRKLIIPEVKPVVKETSVTLFNTLMSDIMNNKNKKKIALEGARLIEDALLANLKMEKLFILKSKELPEKVGALMNQEVEIHRLGLKHMQLWSSITTPPGLVGIFPKPTAKDVEEFFWKSQETTSVRRLPLTVICDNLRDPGNLGSILRSAAGAGCKKILLSKGCVDPWDGKVLRGGSGAQFRIPIISEIPMFNIGTHFEAHSVPSAVETVSSPMTPPSIGIFLGDSDEDTNPKCGIPSVSYTDVDYTQFSEIYLMVGGEAEGIRDDTLQIVSSLKSSFVNSGLPTTLSRIHISLQNGVESLNVANALGILTFEIRRQFNQNQAF